MVIRVTNVARRPDTSQESSVTTPFRVFEELFNDWFSRASDRSRTEAWRPAVDILEEGGNLILRVEVPGVTEKDIELKLEGQLLSVSGEKNLESESESANFYRMESYSGKFSRSFTLPDTVDTDKISANYRNGILAITVPQKPEVRPREIPVSTN
jgi:HSP20 family protein